MNWYNILRFLSTWFIRIGLLIATIMIICLIATARFFMAFLYIIGLAFAFMFGYFFMYLLDLFMMNDY